MPYTNKAGVPVGGGLSSRKLGSVDKLECPSQEVVGHRVNLYRGGETSITEYYTLTESKLSREIMREENLLSGKKKVRKKKDSKWVGGIKGGTINRKKQESCSILSKLGSEGEKQKKERENTKKTTSTRLKIPCPVRGAGAWYIVY